jgi:hypothetical protein
VRCILKLVIRSINKVAEKRCSSEASGDFPLIVIRGPIHHTATIANNMERINDCF